ncbi:unnamed protein product [Linum trigynum]|uniref:Uncharacterized protein n=1 Tax=Linum trigynum TaxID=586398 RepID=A0AAV2DZ34_9ROSI
MATRKSHLLTLVPSSVRGSASIRSRSLIGLKLREWVNDMTETLISRNKLAFVDGTLPRSAAGSADRRYAWDRCDATVKGLLKMAMSREVRNSVRTATTARAIRLDL